MLCGSRGWDIYDKRTDERIGGFSAVNHFYLYDGHEGRHEALTDALTNTIDWRYAFGLDPRPMAQEQQQPQRPARPTLVK